MNILDRIVEVKRREVQAAIDTFGLEVEIPERMADPVSMKQALQDSPTGIIAEFKRRSPSKGDIHPMADVAEIVSGYEAKGASAGSILTDTPFFGGAVSDLMVARQRVSIPLLRKEFIIHPRQISEAAALGADAILLIAAILTGEEIESFTETAHQLGMEVLLEIHNATELEKFCPNVDMVGVNNRDLTTFVTDTNLSEKVAEVLPVDVLRVAESGMTDMGQVRTLRDLGYRGFLIGEAFMRHSDPAEALEIFLNS